jgi:hypothetical protein
MVVETATSSVGIITAGLNMLNALWQTIKGTRKLKAPENKQILENSELRRDFLNNNPNATIVIVEGNMYLGDLTALNSQEKQTLNATLSEKKEENMKKQVDIIESDFYERIKKLKLGSPIDKKINPFMPFLEPDVRNILSLSVYAKKLFDDGDSKEAKRIREDIGNQYGKDGRKLCNLYLSGYIDGMTEYLQVFYEGDVEKMKLDINQKIKRFVKDSDYILFIHSESLEPEITEEVNNLINLNKEYIAIHGAGSNIRKVRKILATLKETITNEGYDINEENLKTLSLCPLLNVSLTKKKKETLLCK